MSKQQKQQQQFPRSFESVRAAVIAFMRQCDASMDKMRDRQLLREEIQRMSGIGGLGSGLKNTGITRKIDPLGRFVIPMELRRTIGISENDPVEIFFDEEAGAVYLQKYAMHKCAICGSERELTPVKQKHLCEDCISKVFEGEG